MDNIWESAKRYALLQVLASTDTEMTEQAYLSLKLFSGFEIAVAHKDGALSQRKLIREELVDLLNMSVDKEHFIEMLDEYLDELEKEE